LLGPCQQSGRAPAEEQDRADTLAVEPTAVSDSLFLGLVFPYAPPKPSGPVTQAALLMTRQGAPIERVVLGTFDGRATVLDSLAERQFPEGALLGFRAYNIDSGTDVAVLRANDTTLHVLKRPVQNDKATAKFDLIKRIPIAPGSRLRLVR
jgi:hypothetical protein